MYVKSLPKGRIIGREVKRTMTCPKVIVETIMHRAKIWELKKAEKN